MVKYLYCFNPFNIREFLFSLKYFLFNKNCVHFLESKTFHLPLLLYWTWPRQQDCSWFYVFVEAVWNMKKIQWSNCASLEKKRSFQVSEEFDK